VSPRTLPARTGGTEHLAPREQRSIQSTRDMLSEEIVEFVEGGVSLVVGTRDAGLRPDATRAAGLQVHPDRAHVTVHLPLATSDRALSNLRDNGAIAVVCSLPLTHRTFQLKGRVLGIRDADAEERKVVEPYRRHLAEELRAVGLPYRIAMQMTSWPCAAVDVEIESVFQQTPGPGAGAPHPG